MNNQKLIFDENFSIIKTVPLKSRQSKVAALVPDIKLDNFGPYKNYFNLTKTMQLIIRDQYRHLVVMASQLTWR